MSLVEWRGKLNPNPDCNRDRFEVATHSLDLMTGYFGSSEGTLTTLHTHAHSPMLRQTWRLYVRPLRYDRKQCLVKISGSSITMLFALVKRMALGKVFAWLHLDLKLHGQPNGDQVESMLRGTGC